MSGTSGWGYFQQGSDQMHEIMELGELLNSKIDCPVHYPAFGKNLFECKCNVIFPVYMVKGARAVDIWDLVYQVHAEGSPFEDV